MIEWLCWRPEHGEKVHDAHAVKAATVEAAANDYVAKNFDRWEYPSDTVVCVQRADGTAHFVVDVEAIPEPTFYAKVRR